MDDFHTTGTAEEIDDLRCENHTAIITTEEETFPDYASAEREDPVGGRFKDDEAGFDRGYGNSRARHLGARGGPLVFPGFLSGLIRVRDFSQSCNALSSAFTAEMENGLLEEDDDDEFSVADLKIMTDAMLVEKALAEVLRGEDSLMRLSTVGNNEGNTNDNVGKQSTHARSAGESRTRRPQSQASPSGGQAVVSSSLRPRGARKKGRPFDRDERAAQLMDETDESRKNALERMKNERDLAKAKAPLRCLREKKERENLYSKDQIALRAPKFLSSASRTPKLACTDHFVSMKDGEVLLTVEIYDSRKSHLKTQEFIVCASQPLTALRDRIYCLMDTVAEKAGMRMPSGYFLIEDTFYNDMRDPDAVNYSIPVIKWAKEQAQQAEESAKLKEWEDSFSKRKRRSGSNKKQKRLPSYRAANMEDVTFMDLQFRLGKHQLYCHLGECKHTIVFRDMRLVHPDDIQNAAAYPVLRFVHKLRHRKCTICDIYRATKVTVEDKLAPETPCYFCENCYFALHYDKDGNLLYDDFTVKDYYHE